MSSALRRVSIVLVGLALVAALVSAGQRWQVERANNTVGIVIDYYATRQLASVSGTPLSDVLEAYRDAGVWAVGLEELTVEQAAAEGLLFLLHGQEAGQALQAMGLGVLLITETSEYIVWAPGTTPEWLAASLRLHIEPSAKVVPTPGNLIVWEIPAGPPAPETINAGWPVTADTLGTQGLGLSPTAARDILSEHLAIVPRFSSHPTITAEQVKFRLDELVSPMFDGSPVVFSGKNIPGNPDLIDIWADYFAEHKPSLGLIEFVRQPGDTALTKANGNLALRVHAITAPEMAKINIDTALERWQRAVRERDVRLLYLRPVPFEHPLLAQAVQESQTAARSALLAQNLEYARQVAGAVRSEGFQLGAPQPYQNFSNNLLLLALITAGIAAAAWLLLSFFIPLPAWGGILLAVFGAACCTLLYLKGYTVYARQLPALAAALIFPVLGIFAFVPIWRKEQSNSTVAETPEKAQLQHLPKLPGGVVGAYWLISAVSLIGALLVVGMLGDVRFLIKTEQFAGVKLAHVFPPFILAIAALLAPLPIWPLQMSYLRARVKQFLDYPVAMKYLAVAAVIGMGALIYIMRTGNNTALPVTGFEQQAREWLENLLVARPRTKEMLFGHPLLIVALDQARRGRVGISRWLCAVAVIGQLSMINTFSHIHTPLLLSLWRSAAGLLLGLAFGWFIARPLAEWCLRRLGLVK